MAKPTAKSLNRPSWEAGESAAWSKPMTMDYEELTPRDDSGGPDYEPYLAMFGDGGVVEGDDPKNHLGPEGSGERLQDSDPSDYPDQEAKRKRSAARRVNGRGYATPGSDD